MLLSGYSLAIVSTSLLFGSLSPPLSEAIASLLLHSLINQFIRYFSRRTLLTQEIESALGVVDEGCADRTSFYACQLCDQCGCVVHRCGEYLSLVVKLSLLGLSWSHEFLGLGLGE